MPESTAHQRRVGASIAGHTGRAEDVRPLLADAEAAVRVTALRALQRVGDLSADELQAALDDPDPTVRIAALELAAGRDDISVVSLAARFDDPDDSVAESAAWACGEHAGACSEVVERLTGMAGSHPDALCRESAVAALGAIGSPAGLAAILGALADKPAVRRRAVIALAPFDGPEVDEALERAARDKDKQVRAAAEELRAATVEDPGAERLR